MAAIYSALALFSLLLIGLYFLGVKPRESWMILLFISVFVVNAGYLAMSVATSLEEALLANRIAYLGSVFLPLCMLMIIAKSCRLKFHPAITGTLIAASIMIFFLAASGGYLPLYYKEVTLVYINGAARLSKVYGPLHFLYLLYLLLYFSLMVASILYALARKHIKKPIHATILAAVVLGNIGVWLVEQFIYVEFEFLSITYIISEVFLLLLYRMLQEYNLLRPEDPVFPPEEASPANRFEQILAAWPGAGSLTSRELDVLNHILENKKRRDIAEIMCVSENTVKKHTSHIFSKLGISSRGELFTRLAAEPRE